jgi:hypothetical protein
MGRAARPMRVWSGATELHCSKVSRQAVPGR